MSSGWGFRDCQTNNLEPSQTIPPDSTLIPIPTVVIDVGTDSARLLAQSSQEGGFQLDLWVSIVTLIVLAVSVSLAYLVQRARYLDDATLFLDVAGISREVGQGTVVSNLGKSYYVGMSIKNPSNQTVDVRFDDLARIKGVWKSALSGWTFSPADDDGFDTGPLLFTLLPQEEMRLEWLARHLPSVGMIAPAIQTSTLKAEITSKQRAIFWALFKFTGRLSREAVLEVRITNFGDQVDSRVHVSPIEITRDPIA